MTRYKPEIILGAILLALFLAVCYWLAPGHVLTKTEIDTYCNASTSLHHYRLRRRLSSLPTCVPGARPTTASRCICST